MTCDRLARRQGQTTLMNLRSDGGTGSSSVGRRSSLEMRRQHLSVPSEKMALGGQLRGVAWPPGRETPHAPREATNPVRMHPAKESALLRLHSNSKVKQLPSWGVGEEAVQTHEDKQPSRLAL
ncbi:unnamed protein product [Arctogadus glacialis]